MTPPFRIPCKQPRRKRSTLRCVSEHATNSRDSRPSGKRRVALMRSHSPAPGCTLPQTKGARSETSLLLVHLRTLGYPTKSFKSPKEAEKSETTRRSSSAYSAESSGWLLLSAGMVVGNFPEVWLPSGITVFSAYGFGAFLLLLGCSESRSIQSWLEKRWLVRAGVLSFA